MGLFSKNVDMSFDVCQRDVARALEECRISFGSGLNLNRTNPVAEAFKRQSGWKEFSEGDVWNSTHTGIVTVCIDGSRFYAKYSVVLNSQDDYRTGGEEIAAVLDARGIELMKGWYSRRPLNLGVVRIVGRRR